MGRSLDSSFIGRSAQSRCSPAEVQDPAGQVIPSSLAASAVTNSPSGSTRSLSPTHSTIAADRPYAGRVTTARRTINAAASVTETSTDSMTSRENNGRRNPASNHRAGVPREASPDEGMTAR